MDFSPPSSFVRKVNNTGICLKLSFIVPSISQTLSGLSLSSKKSTLHSIKSGLDFFTISISSIISSLFFPVKGIQIFGIPFPISKFLIFIIFILPLPCFFLVLGFYHIFLLDTTTVSL